MSNTSENPDNLPPLPQFMGQKSDRAAATAREGIEALELLISERDQLRIRNTWLEKELDRLHHRSESLEHQLGQLQVERDHYMRAVVEMTTHFNLAVSTMQECMQKAREGTYRQSNQVRPQAQEAISSNEAELIRNLAQRLAPETPGGPP